MLPELNTEEIKTILTLEEMKNYFTKEELKDILSLEEFENIFGHELTEQEINDQEIKEIIKKHPLGYLMSNDPNKVVSKFGVKLRGMIYYPIRPILKLMNPYEVHYVRKEPIPKTNRPIINMANHGFKDDLMNLVINSEMPGYTLFGSLDQFYKTNDGYLANLIGTSMVDRSDKESRKAVVPKWIKAMNCGTNGYVFPEGIWCLDPLLLCHNLWPGFYRGIKEANGLLLTHTFHIERNSNGKDKLHIIRDKVIDIKASVELLTKAADLMIIDIRDKTYNLDAIMLVIWATLYCQGISLEEEQFARYNTMLGIKILVEELRTSNADIKSIKDEELVRKAMRAYLSSLHYELLESCGIKKRNELPSYAEMEEEWFKEVERRQSEPDYYTWNEADFRYCEPYEKNIISATEAFEQLENANVTPENQAILRLTQNKFNR